MDKTNTQFIDEAIAALTRLKSICEHPDFDDAVEDALSPANEPPIDPQECDQHTILTYIAGENWAIDDANRIVTLNNDGSIAAFFDAPNGVWEYE